MKISVSAAVGTPLGTFLHYLWYGKTGHTAPIDLLDQSQVGGSPHHGGAHTLTITAPKDVIVLFLALLAEASPKVVGHAEFVDAVAVQIA